MKIITTIIGYTLLSMFNLSFAANNQSILFSGNLYYGVSIEYSTLSLRNIPNALESINKNQQPIYTLTI